MDMEQIPSPDPVTAVYQETAEDLELHTHFHNSYEIIYVLDGKAEFYINNKIYQVGSNSLIFISNLETHHLKVSSYPYRRYFILIRPEYFDSFINEPVLASIFKHRPHQFVHVIQLTDEDRPAVENMIKVVYDESNNSLDFWQTSVKSGLSILFVFLYRRYRGYFPSASLTGPMNTIMDIQRYMEAHCVESLSLQEIARLFYMDMYYLSHLFRKVTGFTFKEYLILLRISKARDQLFHTDNNITNVALNSGFNNVNHFIRIFKKFEGITPFQFRKNFR